MIDQRRQQLTDHLLLRSSFLFPSITFSSLPPLPFPRAINLLTFPPLLSLSCSSSAPFPSHHQFFTSSLTWLLSVLSFFSCLFMLLFPLVLPPVRSSGSSSALHLLGFWLWVPVYFLPFEIVSISFNCSFSVFLSTYSTSFAFYSLFPNFMLLFLFDFPLFSFVFYLFNLSLSLFFPLVFPPIPVPLFPAFLSWFSSLLRFLSFLHPHSSSLTCPLIHCLSPPLPPLPLNSFYVPSCRFHFLIIPLFNLPDTFFLSFRNLLLCSPECHLRKISQPNRSKIRTRWPI